jgi:general secretion pathway protein G
MRFKPGRARVVARRKGGFVNICTAMPRRIRRSARSSRSQRAAGFTLLELLVVMVIIGLLAGLVAPQYFNQIGKSNVKIAKAQIDSLGKALDQYRLDVGQYPSTEEGLDALYTRPENEPHWSGPYLKKTVPLDPWNRPYVYRSPGEHGEYDLYSLGRSGQLGGTGEDVAVTSW